MTDGRKEIAFINSVATQKLCAAAAAAADAENSKTERRKSDGEGSCDVCVCVDVRWLEFYEIKCKM